jgi:hypothetical protein
MAGGGKHTWRSGGGAKAPEPAGVGRPESGGEDPCDIQFETTLNSVNSSAIQDLSRGNRLNLSVVNENNIERLAATFNGVRVGVISHPKTLEVIGCMGSGNEYVAVVVDRQEALCRVRVERQTV